MPARVIPKFNHLHTFKAPGSGKEEAKRAEDSKTKSSQNDQDYRKKRDALEGKDNKPTNKGSNSESGGKRRGSSDEAPKAGSQSLQSAQTTVQFSSGGGGGAFGGLLALFTSSASLAGMNTGAVLTAANQTNNLLLQYSLRGQLNQQGTLLGGELKNLREANVINSQMANEFKSSKFNLEQTTSLSSYSSNVLQEAFSNLLKGISAQASEGGTSTQSTTPIITLFSIQGTFINYLGFNFSGFFFPSTTAPFVFPKTEATTTLISASDGTPIGFALRNENPGTISNYFQSAGLGSPGSFTYKVLGPVLASNGELVQQPVSQPFGVTIGKGGDLTYTVLGAPQVVTDQTFGLTLSPTGDLYANSPKPMSVLLEATAGSTTLPVRINIGPGNLLDQPNTAGFFYADSPDNTLSGYTKPNSDEFASTVFNASGNYTIIGNGAAFMLNSPGAILGDSFYTVDAAGVETPVSLGALGNFVYIKGIANAAYGGVDVGSFPIDGNYTFASNTIFRHVGTSDATVPAEAAYGNFSSYVNQDFVRANLPAVTQSTLTFLPTASYNLTFGGNVLDVFGTKYGVGDVLNVNLPTPSTSSPSSLPNTINMGGNTLAGFGTSYGDLQILRIFAQPVDSLTSLGPTNFIFKGNVLAVDKNIGSALYPHLQTLDLEQSSGATPIPPSNVNVVFHNSIITGNQGNDTFYGDVVNLGDLNNPGRYNGFVTGVNSSTNANGQLVVTTQSGNNTITYGNNIYTGDNALDNPLAVDTYNFTIVGDTGGQPIMQGNALITDFNLTKDVLNLNLTQEVFKALVGAASREHIKQVTGVQ